MSVLRGTDSKIVPVGQISSNPPQIHPASASTDLADAVRKWVHFDNLAEHLNKQVSNARTLRNQYESKILNTLETNNMKQTVIKVSGASLQHSTRFKSNDLGWTMLREQLHEYYKVKGRRDETDEVLDFLQNSRGGKTVSYLKKITNT